MDHPAGRPCIGAAPVRLRSSLRFIDIKSLVIIILSAFSCLYSLIDRSSSLTGRIMESSTTYRVSLAVGSLTRAGPRCRVGRLDDP